MRFLHFYKVKNIFFLLFVSLFFIRPALAVDAEQFATRLKSFAEMGHLKISYSSVANEGDDVIFNDFAALVTNLPDAIKYDFSDNKRLIFENVQEDAIGNYHVERVNIHNFKAHERNSDTTITNLEFKNIILAKDKINDVLGKIVFVQEVNFDKYVFNDDVSGKSIAADTMNMNLNILGNDKYEVSLVIDKLSMPVNPNDNAQDIFVHLGYEKIDLDFNMKLSYLPKDGQFLLDESIKVKDMGALNANLALRLPNIDVYNTINQIKDAENQEDYFRQFLMKTLGESFVDKLEVTYVDDSFVNKVFAYVSETENTSREMIVLGIKLMSSAFLKKINNEDLSPDTLNKLEIFLNDPQSLKITVSPSSEVNLQALMLMAMLNPESLINNFTFQIMANE